MVKSCIPHNGYQGCSNSLHLPGTWHRQQASHENVPVAYWNSTAHVVRDPGSIPGWNISYPYAKDIDKLTVKDIISILSNQDGSNEFHTAGQKLFLLTVCVFVSSSFSLMKIKRTFWTVQLKKTSPGVSFNTTGWHKKNQFSQARSLTSQYQ